MFRNVIRVALASLVLLASVCANPARADSRGCEEGIIRLPDRNGTIEICSSMAAQVPKLSKQLADATKTLGDQKKQIAELTRLVKNLNSVGRDIDPARQERLLSSLSRELEKSSRSGEDRTRRTLQDLSDKLDDIQQQLSTARASPAGAADIAIAMKGDVGDAIARLELASASRMVDSILDKLTQIESKVDSVKDDTAEMRRMLKQIASEIGQLGKQGGLIANPNGYSALYHNARIFAQRGEMDLAMDAYAKVFETGIPFADPIIDVTLLLTRQYGQEAAREALEKKFGKVLTPAARLYALHLLSNEELGDIKTLYLKDPKAAQGFPPLALSYLKRMQTTTNEWIAKYRLDTNAQHDYVLYSWMDWKLLASLDRVIKDQISSGNYLSYFIDPIRGGADIDSGRKLKNDFAAERIFKIKLDNLGRKENVNRKVNLKNSPAVLDYTYLDRQPSRPADRDFYRRPLGTIHFFIWDFGLDAKEPILVCTRKGGAENCVNLNVPDFICKEPSHGRREAENCMKVEGFQSWYTRGLIPNVDANFSPDALLGNPCISRIEYTLDEKLRRKVVIDAKDIVGVHQEAYNPTLSEKILSCGYNLQLDPSPPEKKPELLELEKLKKQPLVFAAVNRVLPVFSPSKENCARIRPYWRVSQSGEVDLHQSLTPFWRYVSEVSQSLQVDIKRLPNQEGVYNSEKNACELVLLSAAAPVLCEVKHLSFSVWRDPAAEGTVLFPTPSVPLSCKMAPELIGDARFKISWPPREKFADKPDTKDLEKFSIYEKLAAYAQGRGPTCSINYENQILNRIEHYLVLLAANRGDCNLKIDRLTEVVSLEKEKLRHRLSPCFLEKNFSKFETAAQSAIDEVAKNCTSKDHAKFLEFSRTIMRSLENEN